MAVSSFDNITFADLQKRAVLELSAQQIDGGERDVILLMQHVFDLDRAMLISCAHDLCSPNLVERFAELLKRRNAGEPVYRIIGQREFHGLTFALGPETLEPRDDTECLIDAVLSFVPDRNADLHFVDLGTGTGAIALSILSELSNARCTAVDISPSALEVAQGNARSHNLDNRFISIVSDWFEALDGQFDFIVSNPPYIASEVVDGLEREVLGYDPRAALDGGTDGLDAYRILFDDGPAYLKSEGFLALEIGHDQKREVCRLADASGWKLASASRDLSGHDRALVFTVDR